MNKRIILYPILCISLFFLTGCGGNNAALMVNEMQFSLTNISKLKIAYDEEKITFKQGTGSQLIVKEYMSEDRKSYRAKIKKKGRAIEITEGRKPFFAGDFVRYIEVYLPRSYDQDLLVTTTDGNIDLRDIDQKLESLCIDSTEGTVKMGNIEATQLKLTSTRGTLDFNCLQAKHVNLETTEGIVRGDEIIGNIQYTTTHGDFDVKTIKGSGKFTVNNEGPLQVNFAQVTGDVWLYNKNDSIRLTLPKTLSFYFEAATRNGSLTTSFEGKLKKGQRSLRGTVGNKAEVTIRVETRNGSIDVVQ